jgi:2-polyprenyl-6-methoxyphenol hydroxylase-like FAD-dependent oxidoreductase
MTGKETTMNSTKTGSPRRRVAVVGAGPGGISTAIAMHQAGHEVRLFERAPRVTPLGGAVLLSLPVLSILRSYGVDIHRLGAMGVTEFRDWKGRLRVRLPFNRRAEQKAGLPGWHYGMLRAEAIERMLQVLPAEILHPNHRCTGFDETADSVRVNFENGAQWEADLLVGADGIRSVVSRQVFGDPKLFHCGITDSSRIRHAFRPAMSRSCTRASPPSSGGWWSRGRKGRFSTAT